MKNFALTLLYCSVATAFATVLVVGVAAPCTNTFPVNGTAGCYVNEGSPVFRIAVDVLGACLIGIIISFIAFIISRAAPPAHSPQ